MAILINNQSLRLILALYLDLVSPVRQGAESRYCLVCIFMQREPWRQPQITPHYSSLH